MKLDAETAERLAALADPGLAAARTTLAHRIRRFRGCGMDADESDIECIAASLEILAGLDSTFHAIARHVRGDLAARMESERAARLAANRLALDADAAESLAARLESRAAEARQAWRNLAAARDAAWRTVDRIAAGGDS